MRRTITVFVFGLVMSAAAWAQKPPEGPQRRLATLAQQKMCDERAEKQFHKYDPKASPSDGYTSHYDGKANVCYMMVHVVRTNQGVSVSDEVTDAFEGREYASYMWINSQGKKYWEVVPTDCTVKPRGHVNITCKSSEEFENLVEQYFGIGR